MIFLVTLAGVEPATCGLGNRRSIHLSYRATPLTVYHWPESPMQHRDVPLATPSLLSFRKRAARRNLLAPALSALVQDNCAVRRRNRQFRWAGNRADKSSASRFLRAARFRNDKKRAHREGDNFRRERIAGMLPRCATSPQSLSCWASANRNPVALLSGHRQRRGCYTGFY